MDHDSQGANINIIHVDVLFRGVWLSDYLQESFPEHKLSRTGIVSEGEDQWVELDGYIKKTFVYELHDAPMGESTGVNKTCKASKSH